MILWVLGVGHDQEVQNSISEQKKTVKMIYQASGFYRMLLPNPSEFFCFIRVG
jgi:hypothetical protein